ncbi:MAG: ABC transporter ATP-binding protein [Actinomycetes bacterium]
MIPVLNLKSVSVVREGKTILGPLDWEVNENERWVILGPNGAGKSTLFALCSAQIHPTLGSVEILGSKLGSVDVFELRPRIGFMGSTLVDLLPEDEKVIDIVLTAAYAMLGRWNESYELWDESRAQALLTTLGVRELAQRKFSTLSEGEKKRVLISRSLMADPEILLLDEPASGLDLGGREDLLNRFDLLGNDPYSPVTLIITHHIEEIPAGSTHALLLKNGKAIGSGPISNVISTENLSIAYDMPINVTIVNNRYSANAIK